MGKLNPDSLVEKIEFCKFADTECLKIKLSDDALIFFDLFISKETGREDKTLKNFIKNLQEVIDTVFDNFKEEKQNDSSNTSKSRK